MEKEFTTYSIAKELKDLGYNEPCLAAYINRKGKEILVGCGAMYFEVDGLCINHSDITFLIAAPLWQQAFKWVNENGQKKYAMLWDMDFEKVILRAIKIIKQDRETLAELNKALAGTPYTDEEKRLIKEGKIKVESVSVGIIKGWLNKKEE